MNNGEQMMIILRINLNEHIKVTSGIVTLGNLRNLLQLCNNGIEVLRVLQIQPNKRTGFVA